MINKNSQVEAIFQEVGSTLIRKGKYESAKIQVKNGNTKDEVCVILKQSRTIQEPEYAHATRNLHLGFAFIEHALNLDDRGKSQRPKCPRGSDIHRWKRSPKGRVADRWKVATDEEKIKVELELIGNDQGLTLLSFEIL